MLGLQAKPVPQWVYVRWYWSFSLLVLAYRPPWYSSTTQVVRSQEPIDLIHVAVKLHRVIGSHPP